MHLEDIRLGIEPVTYCDLVVHTPTFWRYKQYLDVSHISCHSVLYNNCTLAQ